MKTLHEVPLGEVCEVIMGQAPPGASYNDTQAGYPLLAGAADFGAITPKEKKHTTEATRLSQPGDIILCIRATIGDTNWSDKVYCLGRGVAGLRARPNRLDPLYLWHVLGVSKAVLEGKGTGSTFRQISRATIEEHMIPLPPLSEQKRIAAILDKADAIRRKRKACLKLTDDFLRSAFLDLFGDPVTNPKGWDKIPLKKLTSKIGSGSTPRGGGKSYKSEGISLIRSLNIHDDDFRMPDLAFIDEKQAATLDNVVVESGDVLLNITGASVCRCSMVIDSVLPARVNQHVAILRTNRSQLLPEFLLHYLIAPTFKQHLLRMATSGGATREALTKKQLEDLAIMLPVMKNQKRFAVMVAVANRMKSYALDSRTQHETLFASLTQRAFRGEL